MLRDRAEMGRSRRAYVEEQRVHAVPVGRGEASCRSGTVRAPQVVLCGGGERAWGGGLPTGKRMGLQATCLLYSK